VEKDGPCSDLNWNPLAVQYCHICLKKLKATLGNVDKELRARPPQTIEFGGLEESRKRKLDENTSVDVLHGVLVTGSSESPTSSTSGVPVESQPKKRNVGNAGKGSNKSTEVMGQLTMGILFCFIYSYQIVSL